ncbi:MAG: crossover junction endodeoxyribonuclease RuvC [Psychrilyobacter sp.]|nr:crossover junction endodeoxyribonuclease RuvC [Psychrilyobacter sp.]
MRVIGIDPGTAIVGFGIIDYINGKYSVVDYGCIYTSKELSMEKRLVIIFEELNKILKKYTPTNMAVEDLFFFKNAKTVISVGQARGVILLCGELNNIPQVSFTPLQIKMGITGYGRAEKKQIQLMVQRILKLDEIPKPDDAADALAIAITHIHSLNSGYIAGIQTKVSLSTTIKNGKISAAEYRKLLK